MHVCVCSSNLGFSGERIMYQIRMIPGAYYVPDTYVPHSAATRRRETDEARAERCVCLSLRVCDCLPPDLTNGTHTSTVNAFKHDA